MKRDVKIWDINLLLMLYPHLTGKIQNSEVCLFYFESHEQFFSYLATVTNTGDKAANLDLCLGAYGF
jgi:hypothetical protein